MKFTPEVVAGTNEVHPRGGNGNGQASSRRCPDCNTPVIFQEGCLTCLSCGWNKCE